MEKRISPSKMSPRKQKSPDRVFVRLGELQGDDEGFEIIN